MMQTTVSKCHYRIAIISLKSTENFSQISLQITEIRPAWLYGQEWLNTLISK